MRCLQRVFKLIAFHVFLYSQWSTLVSSVDQKSIEFMVIRPGQIPIAGARQLANLTSDSVLECGRLCWNNSNTRCGGFLYQPRPCDAQSTRCQLLEVSNLNLLSYGPVNSSCSEQFYVSITVVQSSKELHPSLTYAIPGSESVIALSSSGDQLFVIRRPKAINQIAVYDTTNFQLLRNITIPGAVGQLDGLTVCPDYSCLYVSEWDARVMYKVNLSSASSGNATIISWPVCRSPTGLSVNRMQNVLLACTSGLVQEYTTNGSRVRELTDNNWLWHAVEVCSGLLVFSRYNTSNQVCLMAINGTVLNCYGTVAAGSGPGQLNNPKTMAVDTQGYVILADAYNKRVLLLNPTLSAALLFPLPYSDTGSITQPFTVWLEESRGRLYVGELGGKYRVLVFDNVFNLNAAFTP